MEKFKAKSIMIGRRPNPANDDKWVAMISFFKENNPHLKARIPFHVLEHEDIEKVRLRDLLNVSYYLAGNDLVINNLTEVKIDQKKGIVIISGKQEELD